jgi:very-short-patch-repair endonuclease
VRLRFRDQKPPSRLEAKFALFWQSLGGPALDREFRFHAERKWRADFAHVESRMLIEVEGGVFIKGIGRHNRAAGFIADAEKYLEAFLAGWNVVRLTQAQITTPNVERLIRRVRIDIGTRAYADTPSENPPRTDAFQHERTDPPSRHPGIAHAEGHP